MGIWKFITKGVGDVIKGIGRVISNVGKTLKKWWKSDTFKVVTAIALAIALPQLAPTIAQGLSTAGGWIANAVSVGATKAWTGIKAAGTALKTGGSGVFRSISDTISSGLGYMKNVFGFGTGDIAESTSKIVSDTGIKKTFPIDLPEFDLKKIASQKRLPGGLTAGAVTPVIEPYGGSLTLPVPTPPPPVIPPPSIKDRIISAGIDMAKDKATEIIDQTISGSVDTPAIGEAAAANYFKVMEEDEILDTGIYQPLASLGFKVESPYIGYQGGQKLFGIG